MSEVTINIGRDFSRYPVGRYRADGDANGEVFREEHLRPHLTMGTKITIQLDDALGYGSSFLEEVFGGLIRHGFKPSQVRDLIKIETTDDSLLAEINGYIADASNEAK